jgi:glycosyltransferase involved in cell wall biosynthesis
LNYSIIIFCYNEQGAIQDVFNAAFEFLQSLKSDSEIIIVNDGSTDETTRICIQIQQQHPSVIVVHHKKNLGIGMALKSGYKIATKEYVCAIPGDGQFNIDELKMVKKFGKYVYYSFYRPETNYSFYRQCLTWFNRLFNQHFLAIYLRDVNWVKVYRKEQIELANPQLKSSLIESEICAKLYKTCIFPIEIPSVYLQRKTGIAKGGNLKTLSKAFKEAILLWWVAIFFKEIKKSDNQESKDC